jgi:hypothetical protein
MARFLKIDCRRIGRQVDQVKFVKKFEPNGRPANTNVHAADHPATHVTAGYARMPCTLLQPAFIGAFDACFQIVRAGGHYG